MSIDKELDEEILKMKVMLEDCKSKIDGRHPDYYKLAMNKQCASLRKKIRQARTEIQSRRRALKC